MILASEQKYANARIYKSGSLGPYSCNASMADLVSFFVVYDRKMSICKEARSRTIRVPSLKDARCDNNNVVSTGNFYQPGHIGLGTFRSVRSDFAFVSQIVRPHRRASAAST